MISLTKLSEAQSMQSLQQEARDQRKQDNLSSKSIAKGESIKIGKAKSNVLLAYQDGSKMYFGLPESKMDSNLSPVNIKKSPKNYGFGSSSISRLENISPTQFEKSKKVEQISSQPDLNSLKSYHFNVKGSGSLISRVKRDAVNSFNNTPGPGSYNCISPFNKKEAYSNCNMRSLNNSLLDITKQNSYTSKKSNDSSVPPLLHLSSLNKKSEPRMDVPSSPDLMNAPLSAKQVHSSYRSFNYKQEQSIAPPLYNQSPKSSPYILSSPLPSPKKSNRVLPDITKPNSIKVVKENTTSIESYLIKRSRSMPDNSFVCKSLRSLLPRTNLK